MKRAIKVFLMALLLFFLTNPVESQKTEDVENPRPVKNPKKRIFKISLYDLYSAYKEAKEKQDKKEAEYIVGKIIEEFKAKNDLVESCSELQKILLEVSIVDMVEYNIGYFKPNDDVYEVRLSIANHLFADIKRHQNKIDSISSPLGSNYDYSETALKGLSSTSDPKLRKYLVLSEFLKKTETLKKYNIAYNYKGRDFELLSEALLNSKKEDKNKQE